MSEQGQGPEDFLLERLNEAASGDAAVRQLRRRYDLLRTTTNNSSTASENSKIA
ncbi:MAG: hypothetical protein IPN07_11005 [Dehalococcoidia bacterium]|nr:hypothetical protein [Dehalococcoidia bacterium]